jgi:hypothetical protein
LIFVDSLRGRPVEELVGLAVELLPFVGVNAGLSVVIGVEIGAPDCLICTQFMEVWAVICGTGWLFREPVNAELCLVVGRVVEQLFPAVTQPALEPVGTAILVFVDSLIGRPVGALFRCVTLLVRRASEFLQVVSENAVLSVVISVIIGAQDRLVAEEVKERVPFILVDQVDTYIAIPMRKAAVLLAVFAETGL